MKKVKDFPKELSVLERKFSGLTHKGVCLWPSLSQSLYHFYTRKGLGHSMGIFYKILKTVALLLFKEKITFDRSKKNKIIASYIAVKFGRKYDLFYRTFEAFKKGEIEFITMESAPSTFKIKSLIKKFSFNLPDFKILFKVNNFFKAEALEGIFNRKTDYFYFLAMAYYECKRIDYLDDFLNEVNPSGYVAFTPACNKVEAVLTQLCNSKGIKTFSLQQGIYADHKSFNLDLLIYYNILSNYYFVWGENSKEELSKYMDSERIIVAGNPKYIGAPKKKSDTFNPKSCGVFLNYGVFEKSNLKMLSEFLEFSKKHPGIKFIIKPHPNWNCEAFFDENDIPSNMIMADKDQDIKEVLSVVDVAIAHNSTLLMEALSYGIPIFRFKDKFSINFPEVKNCFSNSKDLGKLFDKYLDNKRYSNLMNDEHERYLYTFYRPKRMTIPKYYKKNILKRIKK